MERKFPELVDIQCEKEHIYMTDRVNQFRIQTAPLKFDKKSITNNIQSWERLN